MVESKLAAPILPLSPRVEMTTAQVELSGQSVEISLYRRSKRLWIGLGEWLGHRIIVKASTAAAAARRWRQAALARNRVAPQI